MLQPTWTKPGACWPKPQGRGRRWPCFPRTLRYWSRRRCVAAVSRRPGRNRSFAVSWLTRPGRTNSGLSAAPCRWRTGLTAAIFRTGCGPAAWCMTTRATKSPAMTKSTCSMPWWTMPTASTGSQTASSPGSRWLPWIRRRAGLGWRSATICASPSCSGRYESKGQTGCACPAPSPGRLVMPTGMR